MSKNVFLLSADKSSRLVKHWTGKYELFKNQVINNHAYIAKDVYITSDEEIKDGNYAIQFYYGKISIVKCDAQNKFVINNKYNNLYAIKIILTTDENLIKDGIQEIDDEFLEWFVKNPSCEYVEVEKQMLCDYCGQEDCDNLRCNGYKDSSYYEIIIPKEEPKQKNKKVCDCKRAYVNILSGICSLCWNEKFPNEKEEVKEEDLLELKQETLEKAAERIYPTRGLIEKYSELEVNIPKNEGFIEGAKWQAERMYSEEDLFNFAIFCSNNHSLDDSDKDNICWQPIFKDNIKLTMKEMFEQFKKNRNESRNS